MGCCTPANQNLQVYWSRLARSRSADQAGPRHAWGFLCRMSKILIAILRSCDALIFFSTLVVWIYSIEHTRYYIGRCPILKSLQNWIIGFPHLGL